VAVVAITCTLLYCRRKRSTPAPTEPNIQPNTTQYDPYHSEPYPPPQSIVHAPSSPPPHSTTPLYPNRPFTNFPSPQSSGSPSNAEVLIPTTAIDSNDGVSSQGKSPVALSWRPEPPDNRNIPNQLTEEQAAYVQNMYSLNMPAPAIALVVERMLQEQGTPGEVSTGGINLRRGNTNATMPPDYTDL